MRLYVVCPQDGGKIYVPLIIQSHNQLNPYTQIYCSLGCGLTYNFPRSAFFAEPISGGGLGGAIAGGLLGLLGGPVGVVLGVLAGGAIGNGAEQGDRQAADRFNSEVTAP